jgi:RNA polymerase sigma-70 factor (ECF subfamily)
MNSKDFKQNILSLSNRIYPMVARIVGNDADAKDAIQEIMIKLWDKRKQIGNHPNLNALVFTTARNYCLDIVKKKRPKLVWHENQPVLEGNTGLEQFELQELTSVVEQILEKLPQQQKEIMLMRDVDGYEFDEIAAALQLKVEHIRVLLSRARKQVRKELKNLYSYEQGNN